MKSRYSQLLSWLLFLTPFSLLVAETRIPGSPIPIYVPEIFALLYVAIVWRMVGLKKAALLWQDFPLPLQVSFILLGIGVLCGSVFSPELIKALGAAKTWFIVPGLFMWALIITKPKLEPLYYGILAMGVIETAYGFNLFLQHGGRLHGAFSSPNLYAGLLAPIVILSAGLALKRKWLWIITLFLLAGVLLSKSLGGFLGISLALAVWGLQESRPVIRRVLIVLLGILIIAAAVVGVDRLQNLKQSSLGGRVQIWNAAIHLVRIYPVSGTGLRGFDDHYIDAITTFGILPDFPVDWIVPEPHNITLAFWLDTGVILVMCEECGRDY